MALHTRLGTPLARFLGGGSAGRSFWRTGGLGRDGNRLAETNARLAVIKKFNPSRLKGTDQFFGRLRSPAQLAPHSF